MRITLFTICAKAYTVDILITLSVTADRLTEKKPPEKSESFKI